VPESYPDLQRRHQLRRPDLRAGDSDRDAVADILRTQHLAGRLESDEFQDRLDRCYAAKTFGELDELIADLPRPQPKRPVLRTWRWPVIALLPLVIAAAAVSHGHLLWLVFPLFFFVWRPLLWRRRFGWGSHAPSPGGYV
jgi:hypothetical protein